MKKLIVKILFQKRFQIENLKKEKIDRIIAIDPIDGTKEFINKSIDYTINIALCHKHEPIWASFSPATNDIYHAYKGCGAFLNENKHSKKSNGNIKRVIASKSHMNDETRLILII